MKAFVRKEHLAELIKMDATKAHEIAVLLNQGANEQAVAQEIKDEFPDTQVMTWAELMPDIQLMNENMDMMMYIVIGIILLALLFGIVNTMLMVIMERVKELGMLMAIGMNRTKVYLMILLETVYLCLTGGVTGILLATGITALTHQTGINLSAWSQGLNAYGFESIVYPQIGIEQIINVTLMVIAIGIIAAIYPAWKAIRLKPAEAIRIDN
jgi:ABC-type antimicrobial peptide transport system permease subunit